jgi:hypothetical protein
MDTEMGVFTFYQPQPEKFENNMLLGRAAISLVPKGKSTPVFGVIWFSGRVDTDRDAETSLLRDIVVTNARWPESNEADEKRLTMFLTSLMPEKGIPISLERLKASLVTADMEQKSIEGLKHDPPKIVVVNEVSELLLYDGDPRMIPIKNTEFEYAANCAFAVVKDKRSGTCYLSGGKFWYSAKDPKGPWESISGAPLEVIKLMPPVEATGPTPDKPPKIIVATEPTELISTEFHRGGPSARVSFCMSRTPRRRSYAKLRRAWYSC